MTKFIIRRILGLIPTLFIIVTLSFFIIRVAPGGPFSTERNLPKQVLENIMKKYHMDEPLWKQYGRYMLMVARGDLGPSYRYKDRDVNYYIGKSLPNSMVLGAMSLTLALLLGISGGHHLVDPAEHVGRLLLDGGRDRRRLGAAVRDRSVPDARARPVAQVTADLGVVHDTGRAGRRPSCR